MNGDTRQSSIRAKVKACQSNDSQPIALPTFKINKTHSSIKSILTP